MSEMIIIFCLVIMIGVLNLWRHLFVIKSQVCKPACICLIICCFLTGCSSKQKQLKLTNQDVTNVMAMMADIMIHDVTNPPLAARFFAYASLSGYEVISQYDSSFKSMYGVLNNYPQIQKPATNKTYLYQLSALLAMMETAKKMQPSGKLFEAYENHFLDSLKDEGFDADVIDSSKSYAIFISKQVLAYAKADRYNKISNMPRYTPLKGDAHWYPTPPAFFGAVEPYFNTIRPFTLDSASAFKPPLVTPFDPNKGSPFYKLMMDCYAVGGDSLTAEHREIASFWDCNPFAMEDNGHLLVGLKKISPGAHWMGIAGIACKNADKSFNQTVQVYAMLGVTLMDAFICCWDEKYRTNRVRPETAIRKYINPEWKPLLQTPPFPEYLSGHSVASFASATILTHFFGSNLAYTDTIEVNYGLKPRSFTSFTQAANEAAISRFYGGIHFMDAITNGIQQGTKVGNNVLQKIK